MTTPISGIEGFRIESSPRRSVVYGVLIVVGLACSSGGASPGKSRSGGASQGQSGGAAGGGRSGDTGGSGGSVGSAGSGANGGSGGSGSSGGSGGLPAAAGTGGSAAGAGAGGTGDNLDAAADLDAGPTTPSLFPSLANGAPGWHFTLDTSTQDAGFTEMVTGGQFCATMQEYNTYTFGWPASGAGIDLPAGSYTLTYQVWATVPPQMFEAKIASTLAGGTDLDYDDVGEAVGTTPATFSHAFGTTADDPSAGIAFNIGNFPNTGSPVSTICFANVGLTARVYP